MRRPQRVYQFAAIIGLSLVLVAMTGCQGRGARRMSTTEPGLSTPIEGSAPIIEGSTVPGRPVTWVDRHPLFSKPREYYEKTDNNGLVKTAAATVIGVPAGIVGEIKQIVTGTPAVPTY